MADNLIEVIELHGTYPSQEEANYYNRLCVHLRRNIPEKQWMLGVLSTLQPENDFFKKGYQPPSTKLSQATQQAIMIQANNGFFDNL